MANQKQAHANSPIASNPNPPKNTKLSETMGHRTHVTQPAASSSCFFYPFGHPMVILVLQVEHASIDDYKNTLLMPPN